MSKDWKTERTSELNVFSGSLFDIPMTPLHAADLLAFSQNYKDRPK